MVATTSPITGRVLADYGTVDDVAALVEEAHRRGIRVIMDLVINHTSDQHPWFKNARSSPDSEYRDWYMWSNTKNRFTEARIIFLDTETSNWTWDDDAGAYYFHRFFSHQPDLNYDNPRVRAEIIDVCRFWLDIGMDGFRLDAVPYLFKREGTNCENLPETHAFLAELRAAIDAEYPGKVLLAEANQWPEDVVDYFGSPERPECHMCFNFPLMPRMFMGLRREQRYPITEILERTPALPPNSQWGIFLRNHDELTLEMVTDEERDYMWGEYAKDPRAKLNLGIRRRLAPLLNNGRRQMELFHGLILSLPGSPILYYGDEIGMGDNVYLGDRDGVRTPMQWTADSNGGFSQADFAQLYLPPLMDPVYGYQACNVGAQRRNESSMLHWLRRFIAVRKRFPVFGEGDVRGTRRRQPVGVRVPAQPERPDRALRQQPLALRAAGRARPAQVRGHDAGRDARTRALSEHRRAALPADHGAARLLLVHARRAGVMSAARRRRDRHPPRASPRRLRGSARRVHRAAAMGAARRAAPSARPTIVDAAVISESAPVLLHTLTAVTFTDGRHDAIRAPARRPRPWATRSPSACPEFMIPWPDGDPADACSTTRSAIRRTSSGCSTPSASSACSRRRAGRCDSRARIPTALDTGSLSSVRHLRVEQSNTSVEVGDAIFLKHLRRVETGTVAGARDVRRARGRRLHAPRADARTRGLGVRRRAARRRWCSCSASCTTAPRAGRWR